MSLNMHFRTKRQTILSIKHNVTKQQKNSKNNKKIGAAAITGTGIGGQVNAKR